MPEWISITEQLPEVNKRVLVYMAEIEDPYKIDVCFLNNYGDWITSYREEYAHEKVTHWQYLPPLPKEDE